MFSSSKSIIVLDTEGQVELFSDNATMFFFLFFLGGPSTAVFVWLNVSFELHWGFPSPFIDKSKNLFLVCSSCLLSSSLLFNSFSLSLKIITLSCKDSFAKQKESFLLLKTWLVLHDSCFCACAHLLLLQLQKQMFMCVYKPTFYTYRTNSLCIFYYLNWICLSGLS